MHLSGVRMLDAIRQHWPNKVVDAAAGRAGLSAYLCQNRFLRRAPELWHQDYCRLRQSRDSALIDAYMS